MTRHEREHSNALQAGLALIFTLCFTSSGFSADQPSSAAASPAASSGLAAEGSELPRLDSEITLDALIAVLLENNPNLGAATARVSAAKQRVAPAGAWPDPTLAWEIERAPADEAGETAGHDDPGSPGMREHRFRLTQEIPFPGKRGLMRSIMAEEAAMTGAEREELLLELLAELHGAYYDLWFYHAEIAAMRESRDRVTEMAEIAQARYEVGTGMQQDLLKANVEAAMENARIAVLEQEIRSAEARVNALLGRAADLPLGPPVLQPPSAVPADLRADHPSLRARDRAIAREKYRVRLANKEGWPDFMAGAGYVNVRDEPDAWMAMLSIELPIWRGSKIKPQREEARASLTTAEAERAATGQALALAAAEAETAARSAETMVRLYRDSVIPQAEQALASARAAYQTDRASFLEVLDAERSLLSYRIDHARAQSELGKSLAERARAQGDLDLLSRSQAAFTNPENEANR